jgi:hypothetical protein
MTQPTNTFDKYDAVGIREDLSDIIYNISPTDTPFMTNIGRTTADQTTFEWQTDALAAAAANAHIEGDDTAANALTATARAKNYTQISKKVIVISGTLEAVKKAGRKSEIAYQTAKAGKEIKRDMEKALTGTQVAVAGNATTARETASLDAWLTTNDTNGTSGTAYTFSGGIPVTARTDGTDRTWTEALLKECMLNTFNSGGDPSMLMVSPTLKQATSAFAGIADTRYNVAGAKAAVIIGAADIYVSDFGNLEVVPNRFMPTDLAYLIDPEYWATAYLRPYFTEPLAKTGDAEKRHMVVEYGLQAKNEASSGVVRDLTAS